MKIEVFFVGNDYDEAVKSMPFESWESAYSFALRFNYEYIFTGSSHIDVSEVDWTMKPEPWKNGGKR